MKKEGKKGRNREGRVTLRWASLQVLFLSCAVIILLILLIIIPQDLLVEMLLSPALAGRLAT